MFYGDKESYWFAHALTSTPYHFVPGYSGGIGRIMHQSENGQPNLEKERICTLQLLHTLESTGEPFWFNNAIVEYKGRPNVDYIVPEAWVEHDGQWEGGGQRFPNEFCVHRPDFKPLLRITGDLKQRLEKMVHAVGEYDNIMHQDGLIELQK
jgi:Mannosyltransferase putative